MDYSYRELSDIVQLDGPADDSDPEEEKVPLEENDFLGLINAEAIKTLQEENGSSDGLSLSSSSDEGPDDFADLQEEVRLMKMSNLKLFLFLVGEITSPCITRILLILGTTWLSRTPQISLTLRMSLFVNMTK